MAEEVLRKVPTKGLSGTKGLFGPFHIVVYVTTFTVPTVNIATTVDTATIVSYLLHLLYPFLIIQVTTCYYRLKLLILLQQIIYISL